VSGEIQRELLDATGETETWLEVSTLPDRVVTRLYGCEKGLGGVAGTAPPSGLTASGETLVEALRALVAAVRAMTVTRH
jgi:hypothetical protein